MYLCLVALWKGALEGLVMHERLNDIHWVPRSCNDTLGYHPLAVMMAVHCCFSGAASTSLIWFARHGDDYTGVAVERMMFDGGQV